VGRQVVVTSDGHHAAVGRGAAEPGDGMPELGTRPQRRRVALGPHDRGRRQAAPARVHADPPDEPVADLGAPPAVAVGRQRQPFPAARRPLVADADGHPGPLSPERAGVFGPLRTERAPDGEDRDLPSGLRTLRLQSEVRGVPAEQRHLVAPEVTDRRRIGAGLEIPVDLRVARGRRRPRPRGVGADRDRGRAAPDEPHPAARRWMRLNFSVITGSPVASSCQAVSTTMNVMIEPLLSRS